MRNSLRECVEELNNKIFEQKKSYHIAIIYNSSIIYDFDYLKDKINLILTRLIVDE